MLCWINYLPIIDKLFNLFFVCSLLYFSSKNLKEFAKTNIRFFSSEEIRVKIKLIKGKLSDGKEDVIIQNLLSKLLYTY